MNNIACVGYEDGERVLWGGTQKRGKVWQQAAGTVAQWIYWTTHTWTKVSTEDEIDANITRDFLRPKKLTEPYEVHPIGVHGASRRRRDSATGSSWCSARPRFRFTSSSLKSPLSRMMALSYCDCRATVPHPNIVSVSTTRYNPDTATKNCQARTLFSARATARRQM